MKKILYITSSILLSLSMVLWYGCNDKEPESEPFGSIFGMVSVAGTAEPMWGTGVELYYLNEKGTVGALLLRTTTADDGSYSFDDVKAGEYLLRVEVPGYKRTEYKVVVEGGRTARADMQVIVNEEENDEIDDVYIIEVVNLMIQKEDVGVVSRFSASALCEASTLAGYTDWRLPTIKELQILYSNRNKIGGFILTDKDVDTLPMYAPCFYWSSERKNVYNGGFRTPFVDFTDGESYYFIEEEIDNTARCSVRAVRTITE